MLTIIIATALMCPSHELLGPKGEYILDLATPSTHMCPLILANHSDKPLEFWIAGFWPNHKITIKDSAGKPVAPTEIGKVGESRFGSADRDKNYRRDIAATSKYDYKTPPLPTFYKLVPGRYEMTVLYWEKAMGKPVRIESKPIVLRVVGDGS